MFLWETHTDGGCWSLLGLNGSGEAGNTGQFENIITLHLKIKAWYPF